MKRYLLLLLCCFNCSLFAQTVPNAADNADFIIQDVKFSNAGDTLSGSVYKPKNPYAAIVLVHGSGKEARMVGMATFLAKNGLIVLTYDKRGSGKSGGLYAGPEVGTNNIDPSNLNLLASDVSAAVKLLSAQLPSKHIPLGLMGFSQAGWIIPLAVKQNKKINFMIIFSGPVVTTLEQLRFQFYTDGKSNFWDTHTEAEARAHVSNDPDRYQFTATDPKDALNQLSIPGLWIFGGKDIQIPVGLSMQYLTALKDKGKPYDCQLFPALGHNTSSLKSPEPIMVAMEWIKTMVTKNRK